MYSYVKYIELLVDRGMSEEEAIEYTDNHVFPVDGSTPFVNQLSRPIIIDDTGV